MNEEVPARIGKYEVVSRLGAGGMAEVFLARLPGIAGFSKTVVVKRLLPELARDPRFVQLFVEEAKLAAQVQHKNVVQIFELGSEGSASSVFMAMEYVMGVDLKSLLVHAGRSGSGFRRGSAPTRSARCSRPWPSPTASPTTAGGPARWCTVT